MRDYLVQVSFQTVVSCQDGLSEENVINAALPTIKDNILCKIENGELVENIDWVKPDEVASGDIWY